MGFNPSISGISQVLNTLQKMTETRQPGMDSGMPNLLQAGMGTGQDFSKTLAALSESMELSLVNQALELGSGGSDKNSDGFFGGGMGGMSLDKMQMNMLMTTLNQMQQASQPQAAAQQAAQVSASGETDSQKNDSRNPGQSMTQTTGAGAQGVGEILGELSRYFESGTDGVGAIGFDRMGGTSYGMFQLSSAQGVVKDFINFLSDKNPEWASRLATAGPANTGSTSGGMPDAWREIAKSAPQAFEKLQSEFVQGSHYQPALKNVLASLGVAEGTIPPAVKEVLFSTAIQHGAGGASSIFEKALGMLGNLEGGLGGGRSGDMAGMFKGLIEKVYDLRAGQFDGSTKNVQKAVASRFGKEREMALAMLEYDQNQAQGLRSTA